MLSPQFVPLTRAGHRLYNNSSPFPEGNPMMKLVGVDVYVESETLPDVPKDHGPLKLTFISNRGTKIWPGERARVALIDLMQCRYEAPGDVSEGDVTQLLLDLDRASFRWTKAQKLWTKDGEKMYSQPY